MSTAPAKTSTPSTPASAQTMPGLSKRAQAIAAPRKFGFCTPIEPAGSGAARHFKNKASI